MTRARSTWPQGNEQKALDSSGTNGRRKFLRILSLAGLALGGLLASLYTYTVLSRGPSRTPAVQIPEPRTSGSMSVEEAIGRRRSVRRFAREALTLSQLSQILWAAQGVTEFQNNLRAAPSAGGLYPLELYLVVRKDGVTNLLEGVYHYETGNHTITFMKGGDYSAQLMSAALDQEAVGLAAVSVVICAKFDKTTAKYGDRGVQYVFQESGHAAENVYLQATSLGLATVVMGAFDEDGVKRVLGISQDERPVYVQPLGVPSTH